jgi:hypothetical protein
MDSQPTGLVVPAFVAPSPGQILPTMLPQDSCQKLITDNMAAPAPIVVVGGAELMAAPVMGGGAPAGDLAPTEDQRDEAEDRGEDFVRSGQEETPTQKNAIVKGAP